MIQTATYAQAEERAALFAQPESRLYKSVMEFHDYMRGNATREGWLSEFQGVSVECISCAIWQALKIFPREDIVRAPAEAQKMIAQPDKIEFGAPLFYADATNLLTMISVEIWFEGVKTNTYAHLLRGGDGWEHPHNHQSDHVITVLDGEHTQDIYVFCDNEVLHTAVTLKRGQSYLLACERFHSLRAAHALTLFTQVSPLQQTPTTLNVEKARLSSSCCKQINAQFIKANMLDL